MIRQSIFDFDNPDVEREIQIRQINAAVTLRPYQVEAVKAVFREWDAGHTATLLALPTGCGKTVCFTEIMRHWIDQCENS